MIDCLFVAVMLFVMIYGLRWIAAGIAVVAGNKDALHSFGNLCDKDL